MNFTNEDKMLWYYLYENTLFTNKWDAALFGKESAWEVGWGRERVALIKSLIMLDRKRWAWGVVAKFGMKMSADILFITEFIYLSPNF